MIEIAQCLLLVGQYRKVVRRRESGIVPLAIRDFYERLARSVAYLGEYVMTRWQAQNVAPHHGTRIRRRRRRAIIIGTIIFVGDIDIDVIFVVVAVVVGDDRDEAREAHRRRGGRRRGGDCVDDDDARRRAENDDGAEEVEGGRGSLSFFYLGLSTVDTRSDLQVVFLPLIFCFWNMTLRKHPFLSRGSQYSIVGQIS